MRTRLAWYLAETDYRTLARWTCLADSGSKSCPQHEKAQSLHAAWAQHVLSVMLLGSG